MVASRIVPVTVMVLVMLGHGLARAGSGTLTVAIEYSAAPVCPDLVDFKTIVSSRLGYDAFAPDAPDRVLVEISPVGRTFTGRIEWRTAEGTWLGERKFPSRSGNCQELARAMAFTLALQIQFSTVTGKRPGAETEATPEPAEANPAPEDSPPAPPKVAQEEKPPPAIPEVASEPKPPSRTPWPRFGFGAGAAAGFGLSSKVVPLARVFASLGWSHLAFELGGEAGWPTITRREDGAGFSQRLFLASAAVCGSLSSASACVLAKVGQIRIAGRDIDEPAWASGPIFETGLRLAWTQALVWRLFAAAHATGLINVTHWTINLDRLQVWSSPRLAATVGLDLGVSLP